MTPLARDQQGQSTMEFALTLMLLMGFIMFFIQLALMLGFSNYVQYATFMSARAYLSAGETREDQEERATEVAVRMLKRGAGNAGTDRLPFLARGEGGDGDVTGLTIEAPEPYVLGERATGWLQGVRYTFRSRIFLIPLAGLNKRLNQAMNSVSLTSESWLGRDPAGSNCKAQLGSNGERSLYDNGC